MAYVKCSVCGGRCSDDVSLPGPLIVRAWVECTECQLRAAEDGTVHPGAAIARAEADEARVAKLEAELRNTGVFRIPPKDPDFLGMAYIGKGGEVVVCGTPPDDEHLPEEQQHNCDAMGCGRSHVLWRSGPGALAAGEE